MLYELLGDELFQIMSKLHDYNIHPELSFQINNKGYLKCAVDYPHTVKIYTIGEIHELFSDMNNLLFKAQIDHRKGSQIIINK